MKEKEDYDAALPGGTVQLPDQIQTYKFTADRVAEIKSLLGAIANPTQTKLVFQTLPKHMRRRAMSHNPKRLPRKYRAAHIAQMRKSGVATVGKRPSRKYRRKAGNLQREYVRRQRRAAWLETHIWHAKRFHMVERWGYKLAQSSCDKTYRSSYRATVHHCLLQDISYMSAIELIGPLERLAAGFAGLKAPTGLGVAAKCYIQGQREGTIDLFRNGLYPLGALGRVSFIWKPSTDEHQLRTVWLFAHASVYTAIVAELVGVFELKIKTPLTYKNAHVCLTELKGSLNRFRLTGRLSQAILSKAFRCKAGTNAEQTPKLHQFMSSVDGVVAYKCQSNYWANVAAITSPAVLQPNMVLGLTIEDPRINRPSRRSKALPAASVEPPRVPLEIPTSNSVSAIWSAEIRQELTAAKMPTSKLCEARNEYALVPGAPIEFEQKLTPIPVMLIQRPGCQNGKSKQLGYGSGYDVLVPGGYGISTWMCLIMWGAKAGGLREHETVHREGGHDEHLPDTMTARHLAADRAKELRTAYFRKPPNKRENYKKLSITSPFTCSWLQLVKDWSAADGELSDFYVLRDHKKLDDIQQALLGRGGGGGGGAIQIQSNCLIPIQLQMVGRGTIDDNAIICLAKTRDFRTDKKQRKSFRNDPVYTEPLQRDESEAERKMLRSKHLALLKRLRRRRVRSKRRKQETAERRVLIAKPETAAIVAEQLRRMRELWLPEEVTSMRHQCSREVIGQVTHGNFSFIEATEAAVGYVSWRGLQAVMDGGGNHQKQPQVLVRATNSRQYRLAVLKVCPL